MPRISAPAKTILRGEREADLPADVQGLARRIAAARRLCEHHLWEILRTLPSLAEARIDPDFRRAFRALMERDDLDAASRALLAAAQPACRLDGLHAIDGVWIARLVSDGPVPRTVAVHADRVAAVMAALVALDRSAATQH